MTDKKQTIELMNLAESLITFGKVHGADQMEVSISKGSEFNVDIRLGEIENLMEAGSKIIGIRVIKDMKTAYATSSDFKKHRLQNLIKNAIYRTTLADADECSGLPPAPKHIPDIDSLDIYDPEIPELDSQKKIKLAKETEKFALADPRITNSHGASFETREIQTVLANSNGFLHKYNETFCSLSIGLQAGDTDSKVEDYWASSKRHLKSLESPEIIARKAIERTVRHLNSKKIKTKIVPVVFEPLMTSWLLGFLFSCVSGMSVYLKASFLADKMNKQIANEGITIIDDGLIPGKLGTRPFDSEGVPCGKTIIIDKGILRNFLCNSYAARKLKLQSTGNADESGVGPNNFYLQPGIKTPEEITASLEEGLILTRTIGHGLNPITGDISRGAFGLWVEKGEIIYPVSEVTISGNLGKILYDIETIGNDLEFLSAFSGPTIKVKELTVSGQ